MDQHQQQDQIGFKDKDDTELELEMFIISNYFKVLKRLKVSTVLKFWL